MICQRNDRDIAYKLIIITYSLLSSETNCNIYYIFTCWVHFIWPWPKTYLLPYKQKYQLQTANEYKIMKLSEINKNCCWIWNYGWYVPLFSYSVKSLAHMIKHYTWCHAHIFHTGFIDFSHQISFMLILWVWWITLKTTLFYLDCQTHLNSLTFTVNKLGKVNPPPTPLKLYY